jgi:hypothetical protein
MLWCCFVCFLVSHGLHVSVCAVLFNRYSTTASAACGWLLIYTYALAHAFMVAGEASIHGGGVGGFLVEAKAYPALLFNLIACSSPFALLRTCVVPCIDCRRGVYTWRS